MSDVIWNARVNGQPNYLKAAPCFQDGDHKIRMLVVSSSYLGTPNPLNCCQDARNVEEFARECEVQRLSSVGGDQCTRQQVLQAVQQTCSRCQPEDYFVLYMAGFGASIREMGGAPGAEDEAFVCVDHRGFCSLETLLGDSEFSRTVLEHCHRETRILILVDICHPRVVFDLSRKRWAERQAVCITGCRARETSGDMGLGGILTHSLLLAVAKLSRVGHEDYSVGALYNATLRESYEVFYHAWQDISIQAAPGFSPGMMAWPLLPPLGYEAPLAACAAGADPASKGVRPEMLKLINRSAILAPVSVEEYVAHVVGADVVEKGFRTCTVRASRVCYGPGGCSLQ